MMGILLITSVFIIALGQRLRIPLTWTLATAAAVFTVFMLNPTQSIAVLLGLFVMAPFLSRVRLLSRDQRLFPTIVLGLCVLSIWFPTPAGAGFSALIH